VATQLASIDPRAAGRTLVVGCGQGVDITMALDRFCASEVVAIDVDPVQVERARRRLGARDDVHIDVGDVLALAAPDASFDTVLDLGAVHLVPEWRHAYAEIARVLRPGGTLRFETVVGRSFRAAMRLSTDGFAAPASGYSSETVRGALRDCGLDCPPSAVVRPRLLVLTGLVGDLIGVATKR
jgi:ubiquinone/menaquinone biosynthesis C-methylase UbiE